PRRPSADGVTRLPSPLPYVFHLQGVAPKLLTHRACLPAWSLALPRRQLVAKQGISCQRKGGGGSAMRDTVGWRAARCVCAGLVLALVVGTASLSAAAQPLERVRLSEVVRSVFYAPQYAALALGFFADEGLDIELSTAWGAHNGMAALLSGGVDIGFFGPEATLYVYQQGAPDPVIGFAQLTQRDGSFLMARGQVESFRWEDVRGRLIVGARKGGVPQMVLEWLLRANGIEPFRDVGIITHLEFPAAAGAFEGGLGDYVAQFDPALTQLERNGTGTIVVSLGAEAGDIAYTVYHARRSYMERHPDI